MGSVPPGGHSGPPDYFVRHVLPLELKLPIENLAHGRSGWRLSRLIDRCEIEVTLTLQS
jgi:hypothetical protein